MGVGRPAVALVPLAAVGGDTEQVARVGVPHDLREAVQERIGAFEAGVFFRSLRANSIVIDSTATSPSVSSVK